MSTDFFFYYPTKGDGLASCQWIGNALKDLTDDEFDIKMELRQRDHEWLLLFSINRVLTDAELEVVVPALHRVPGYDGWGQEVEANSE